MGKLPVMHANMNVDDPCRFVTTSQQRLLGSAPCSTSARTREKLLHMVANMRAVPMLLEASANSRSIAPGTVWTPDVG